MIIYGGKLFRERTFKEFCFEFVHPLKYARAWLAVSILAVGALGYSHFDQARKSYDALLQGLPPEELHTFQKFDEDRSGSLDPRELTNLLQEYRFEKRGRPLQLSEVPLLGELGKTLDDKVKNK